MKKLLACFVLDVISIIGLCLILIGVDTNSAWFYLTAAVVLFVIYDLVVGTTKILELYRRG